LEAAAVQQHCCKARRGSRCEGHVHRILSFLFGLQQEEIKAGRSE
jgi:hypothetical protein